ncbi:HTH-type transcriptional regulator CysB [Achromobacter insuavis]|uniref:LysR substrate-binding domain-containing protein n=1 Tax=Achromobacter insuavis TaxID=1287735 RepID=UPI0014687341|nr:LysR substrate-binding domain-containing protein [Achromobacter insuavis]CAB3883558.1 HTH-type transcriptional regulator CysB [Achromobacter insuavis]
MSRILDLELLNTLVVVSDAGSLSAAAPRLYRSQSAISEQVRKLEQACGVALLVRGKTGASLTPAGERLVGHAQKLLSLSDAAWRDMQGAQLAGDLRLAITDYFRPHALPIIIRRIREQFPQLRLHVCVRKSAWIEHEANAGSFDIGVSMTILHGAHPPDQASSARIRLRREPLHWIADSSFALTPTKDPLPLVVLPDTCSLQRFAVHTLDAHGINYRIEHTASDIGGLHLALAAGLGIACLNASATPPTAAPLDGYASLPSLPDVEFSLAPPRYGEPQFVSDVRNALAAHLG